MRAIEELQDAGVEPDVWKVEGLDRREDCENIVAVAHRGGRDQVGCIILGRGENDPASARVAGRRGQRERLHRFCRGPDGFLGAAGGISREEDYA